jgi:hypothetical protein
MDITNRIAGYCRRLEFDHWSNNSVCEDRCKGKREKLKEHPHLPDTKIKGIQGQYL